MNEVLLFEVFIVGLIDGCEDGPDIVQLVLQGAIHLFELSDAFQKLFFSRHDSIIEGLAGHFQPSFEAI